MKTSEDVLAGYLKNHCFTWDAMKLGHLARTWVEMLGGILGGIQLQSANEGWDWTSLSPLCLLSQLHCGEEKKKTILNFLFANLAI